MRTTRLAAMGAAVAALGVAAPPALAHVEVASTSPKAGAKAGRSTSKVTVTFTGPIKRGTVTVTRKGTKVSLGNGGRDPRNISRLTVGLQRGLAKGRYTARWSAEAADGHEQRGSFKFRLK